MNRCVVLVLLAAAVQVPARATEPIASQELIFHATASCAVACSYYLDVTGGGEIFDACAHPFPEVAYDDIVVTAPQGANLMVVEIRPKLDWDLFICEVDDTANHNGVPNEHLGVGCSCLGGPDQCQGPLGPGDPTGLGCREKANVLVSPGTLYTLRAYAWADVNDCPGTVRFSHIG